MPLNEFITNEVFQVFLIFCRVGSCFMLLPGFGDAYVSPRIRLVFCLVLSLALVNAVPDLPKLPGGALATILLLFHEVAIGLLIGGIIKIMTSSIHIAGTVIAAQSSLGQATLFDPTQQTQGAVFGTFMQIITVALIFAMDFHHLLISGIVASYDTFSATVALNWGDFSELAIKVITDSFAIGVQISAPLIVVGLLVNITSGVLAKLMPAFQVFFVIMPLQILVALFVFMVTLSSMLLVYMHFLDQELVTVFPNH